MTNAINVVRNWGEDYTCKGSVRVLFSKSPIASQFNLTQTVSKGPKTEHNTRAKKQNKTK